MILALALAALAQQPQSQFAFHPREPLLLVEIPDVAALLDAYENAPLAHMLEDDGVQAAVARLETALGFELSSSLDLAFGSLGVPGADGVGGLTELARRARALSLSIAIHEGRPGELQAALERLARVQTEVLDIEEALAAFAKSQGRAAASLAELRLDAALASDEWGRSYELFVGDDGNPKVRSLGADGAAGGEGEAADIDAQFDSAAWSARELQRRWSAIAVAQFASAELAAQSLDALSAGLECEFEGPAVPLTFGGGAAQRRAFRVQSPFEAAGWNLSAGSLAVIGLGAASFDDVAARVAGQSASFASSASWTMLEKVAGPARGVSVARGVLDAGWLSDTAGSLTGRGGGGGAGLSASTDAAPSAFRMQLVGERFVTDLVRSTSAGASWFAAVGNSAPSKELLAAVPGDAAGVLVTHLDSAVLQRQFLELLGLADGGADQLRALEAKHGFDLRKDVFDSLGGGAALYLMPISTLGAPNAIAVLELRDAAAFEKGLRGLSAALAEQQLEGAKLKSSKYRDAPLWTLNFESASESPIPIEISPTLAIVGGRAVLTTTALFAKREVKRALGEEAGAPHALAALDGVPAGATMVGSMDWSAMLASLYTAARGALALAGGMVELPLDLGALTAALPEKPETFTRFFKPTHMWARPTDGGFHVHLEASFGPETWLGLVGLGAGVFQGLSSAARALEEPGAEPEVAAAPERTATEAALDRLATRLVVYKLDQGSYPAGLEGLTGTSPSYPNGYLDGQGVPLDGWGRSFHYQRASDGESYRLWSSGPDGVDAEGAGDDVVP